MSVYLQMPPVSTEYVPSVFQSRRTVHACYGAIVDRIEATIYSCTVSGDPKNAGMHAHVAAFPYLDVTIISIRQPCLNFAIYSTVVS